MMLLQRGLPYLLSLVATTSISAVGATIASGKVVVAHSQSASSCAKHGGLFIPKTSLCGYKQNYINKRLKNSKLPSGCRKSLKHALKGLHHTHKHGNCPCHSDPYYGMGNLKSIKGSYQRKLYSHEMMLQNQLNHPNFPPHRRSHSQLKIRGLRRLRCLDGHCKAHQKMTKYEVKLSKLQAQLRELEHMTRSTTLTHDMKTILKRYLNRLRRKMNKLALRVKLERQNRDLYTALMDPSLNQTMRQALQSQMQQLKKRIAKVSRPVLVGVGKEQMMLKAHIADLERMLKSPALSPGARRELQTHLNALRRRMMSVGQMVQLDRRKVQIRHLLQQDNLNSVMREALQVQLKGLDKKLYTLKHKPKKLSSDMRRQQSLMNQQQCLNRLFNDPNVSPQMKKVLQAQLKDLKYQTKQIKKCQGINRQVKELQRIMASPTCTPQMRSRLQKEMKGLQVSYKQAHRMSCSKSNKAQKTSRSLKKASRKSHRKVTKTSKSLQRKIRKKASKTVSRRLNKVGRRGHRSLKKNVKVGRRASKGVKNIVKRGGKTGKRGIKRTKRGTRTLGKHAKRGAKGIKKGFKKFAKGSKKGLGFAKGSKKGLKRLVKGSKKGLKGLAKGSKKGRKGVVKGSKKGFKGLKGLAKGPKKGLKGLVKGGKKVTGGITKVGKNIKSRGKTILHGLTKDIKGVGKHVKQGGKAILHNVKKGVQKVGKQTTCGKKTIEKAMYNQQKAGVPVAKSIKKLQSGLKGISPFKEDKYGLF